MASTFGLLVAALGKTPGDRARRHDAGGADDGDARRRLGADVRLPRWLQQVTIVVPARWAVDGLDAMTWRGLGFSEAVLPSLVLLGFAVLFGALALARFRWEEA